MTRIFILAAAFLLCAGAANAQSVGNGNGNGNSGTGTGNGNGNGNNVITFQGRNVANTPSFAAPGLAAAGIESCLASASAGGAGGGIAVTIAGPVLDQGCNIRLYARTLYATGHRLAATQLLCNDPQVAAALATEGVRCFVGVGVQVQNQMAAPPPPRQQAGLFGGMFGCKHYVLFQGCMDEPPPSLAAAEPQPEPQPVAVAEPVKHRHKLARRTVNRETASAN